MKPNHRRRARRLAMQALYQWHVTQDPVAEIQQQFLCANDMQNIDTEYFQALVQETVQSVAQIDDIITPTLDRPLRDLNPVELAILRLATYELVYRLDIPYRVVINEALELAKTFGATEGFKYVNAVLDAVARKTRLLEISRKKSVHQG